MEPHSGPQAARRMIMVVVTRDRCIDLVSRGVLSSKQRRCGDRMLNPALSCAEGKAGESGDVPKHFMCELVHAPLRGAPLSRVT